MSLITEISEKMQAGKAKDVVALVQQALDEGVNVEEILGTLLDGMNVISEKFKNNEIFVPEVLLAARAMTKGMTLLKPLLIEEGVEATGKVVIGTIEGDLHDIGKNLVGIMVEAAGFEVVDLGIDVPAEKFVEAIKAHPDCKVVGVSALLTTTMESMRNTVKTIIDAGLKSQVKIMVGGAPITQAFADEIGADAYTTDAASAAAKARELASK